MTPEHSDGFPPWPTSLCPGVQPQTTPPSSRISGRRRAGTPQRQSSDFAYTENVKVMLQNQMDFHIMTNALISKQHAGAFNHNAQTNNPCFTDLCELRHQQHSVVAQGGRPAHVQCVWDLLQEPWLPQAC
jgi:hypothetical protein